MSREKQIEGMAKVLRPLALCPNCLSSLNRDKKRDGDCYRPIGYECSLDRDILKYCEALYNADYRKQEWISVEERLPEDTQMCLAYATVYFVPDHVDDCDHCERIIVTKYYKEFGFMDWDVHYWMPLPEAPKMKGGEQE